MSETRKIAAILVSDMVGYSRLARADEDRTLSRLRGLRSDLIDPTRPPFVFWAHAMPGQLLSGVCLRMYEPQTTRPTSATCQPGPQSPDRADNR